MAQMPDLQSGPVAGNGARHVNCDRAADPAAHHRLTEPRVTPHLLCHGKRGQTVPVRLCPESAGVSFDRIQVEHVRVGRNPAPLMQRHCGFHETRITADEKVQEHVFLPV